MHNSDQRGRLRSLGTVLDGLDERLEDQGAGAFLPVSTSFSPLDTMLGGGLHPGNLVTVGGGPGVGKTVLMLQWAQTMARAGTDVLFVNYEHDDLEIVTRLVSMELREQTAEEAEKVRTSLSTFGQEGGLEETLSRTGAGAEVLERLRGYSERLHLVRASGAHTGLDELAAFVAEIDRRPLVLFVDYLQKVNVTAHVETEDEKVTIITEGLKDLALRAESPVVAAVAVEMEGLKQGRLRMHHFRGSSALVFEADVALVMNNKIDAVAKAHLAYDPLRAATFRDKVVVSVEKNRAGPNLVNLEFTKDFAHFRFDPQGGICQERLADDRFDLQ